MNKLECFWSNKKFTSLYSQKGEQGDTGPTGLFGPRGTTGDIGETGYEGMPGIYYCFIGINLSVIWGLLESQFPHSRQTLIFLP